MIIHPVCSKCPASIAGSTMWFFGCQATITYVNSFYLIPIVKRVGTGNEVVLCHAVFNTRLISGNDHFKRPSSNLADDCFFFMALKKDS